MLFEADVDPDGSKVTEQGENRVPKNHFSVSLNYFLIVSNV